MSSPFSAIGSRIQSIRKSRRKTQKQVAEELGANYRHLQKIEAGRADFKLSMLARLANYLDVEPCFLANVDGGDLFRILGLPCHSLLLDAIPVGILLVDGEGEIRLRNRRGSEILGLLDEPRALETIFARARELVSQAPESRLPAELPKKDGTPLAVNVEARSYGCGCKKSYLILLFCDALPRQTPGVRFSRASWTPGREAGNIRGYRHALGRTQNETAEAMDLSLRYFQKLESGKLDLKYSSLANLSQTLGVKTCQLLVQEGLRPSCTGAYPCIGTLLDNLPFGVMAANTEGELAYVNRTYHVLNGTENRPGKPHYWWELLEGEAQRQWARDTYRRLVAERPAPEPLSRTVTYKDGTHGHLTSHWNFLYAGDGQLLGLVSFLRKSPA